MKIGDNVLVQFMDESKPERGELVDHMKNWQNVTIKTDRGGLVNGMVKEISEIPDFVQVVYPEAKGIKTI